MNNLDLFPVEPRMSYMPPATHRNDPSTSHKAEKRVTDSGVRLTQAQRVLNALKRLPLHTSAELAEAIGMNRHAVARRLPDLLHNGLVRQCGKRECTVTGQESVTWDLV